MLHYHVFSDDGQPRSRSARQHRGTPPATLLLTMEQLSIQHDFRVPSAVAGRGVRGRDLSLSGTLAQGAQGTLHTLIVLTLSCRDSSVAKSTHSYNYYNAHAFV